MRSSRHVSSGRPLEHGLRGIIPEVVLEDRTDFILVTTAPPHNSVLWENDLHAGRIDLQIAVQCGELLATVHNETAGVPEIK